MNLKRIESARLLFLPFEEGDFNHLFSVLGSEDVCKYLPVKPAYSKEQVQRVLNYFMKTFVLKIKTFIIKYS